MNETERESREQRYLEYMRLRGVCDPCDECGGLGVKLYGSTATWRGGVGGAAMTHDVCDVCWGSGDKHNHWTDLRAVDADIRAQIRNATRREIALQVGVAGFDDCEQAVAELASELEKLSRGRKTRPRWFSELCYAMAKSVRRLVEACEKAEQGIDGH